MLPRFHLPVVHSGYNYLGGPTILDVQQANESPQNVQHLSLDGDWVPAPRARPCALAYSEHCDAIQRSLEFFSMPDDGNPSSRLCGPALGPRSPGLAAVLRSTLLARRSDCADAEAPPCLWYGVSRGLVYLSV